MSTRIMGQCWPLQMRPPAKAVLIALADMANDEGYCWPSLERLCERTCFGRSAVIVAIRWLEEARLVRADRGNGRKTTYWVEPWKSAAEAVDNTSKQFAAQTGSGGEPVRHADPTGSPRGPNRFATRTLIVKNRKESKTPQPPANAGGDDDSTQMLEDATPGGDGFDEIWAIYPRKKAELRARRQWVKLNPDAALRARIAASIEAHARTDEWQRDGGRFVPMLSAWLHGERWRDQAQAAAPAHWWLSSEGIKAMGVAKGMPFSLDALGNSYTDDERDVHWRSYRAAVMLAAGNGPWSERMVS